MFSIFFLESFLSFLLRLKKGETGETGNTASAARIDTIFNFFYDAVSCNGRKAFRGNNHFIQ